MSKLKAGWNKSTHPLITKNRIRNHKQWVRKRKRNELLVDSLKLKSASCSNCGYTNKEKPWYFDYHHLDPSNKKFTISKFRRSNKTLKRLEEELSKCVVLCKFCHADIIHKEFESRKNNYHKSRLINESGEWNF